MGREGNDWTPLCGGALHCGNGFANRARKPLAGQSVSEQRGVCVRLDSSGAKLIHVAREVNH